MTLDFNSDGTVTACLCRYQPQRSKPVHVYHIDAGPWALANPAPAATSGRRRIASPGGRFLRRRSKIHLHAEAEEG